MAEVVHRKWRDVAFYHDLNKKDKIEGILIITDPDERVITQQLTVKKFLANGNFNPDWKELLDQVGEEKVHQNTVTRNENKARNLEKKKKAEQSKIKVSELERLFESKVRALEIDEIKNSKNTELKSKLRRSKNIIEMQTVASLILMEEMGVKFVIEDKESNDD